MELGVTLDVIEGVGVIVRTNEVVCDGDAACEPLALANRVGHGDAVDEALLVATCVPEALWVWDWDAACVSVGLWDWDAACVSVGLWDWDDACVSVGLWDWDAACVSVGLWDRVAACVSVGL